MPDFIGRTLNLNGTRLQVLAAYMALANECIPVGRRLTFTNDLDRLSAIMAHSAFSQAHPPPTSPCLSMTASETPDLKRILIIDDDAEFAESLALTIRRNREFEIKIETESSNARQTALEFAPDLILLDVMMDKLSGPDLYFLFQRDGALKKLPTIVISGVVDEKGKHSSAVGLGLLKRVPRLSKPFQLNDLLTTIDLQLEKAAKKARTRAKKKVTEVKAVA